jgi:VacB/RNase II family 3'-5' exoribonuclease
MNSHSNGRTPIENQKAFLNHIGRKAMAKYGFLPDFSPAAMREVQQIKEIGSAQGLVGKDLRHLPWSSIDNDDTRDLDQLTAAELLKNGQVKLYVAVADVDRLVKKQTPVDKHAFHNTTSVYTAGGVFPMLPETLSNDLTSLKYGADRQSMIVEMLIGGEAEIMQSDIYPAVVRNNARLTYAKVSAFLAGRAGLDIEPPYGPALEDNLRLQESVARRLRVKRHKRGALSFDTIEVEPVFAGNRIKDLEEEKKYAAREIIEDFMIAANDVTARFLQARRLPSLRRVLRSPKRWDRIVEVASRFGFTMPVRPDPIALSRFLAERKATDPVNFPDLSLIIIKLLGQGEYYVGMPGEKAPGHFGLAVKDYTHSTAPNRRFSDLVTQRILKAELSGERQPYESGELIEIAGRCTEQEDEANKVERMVVKSAAAMLLSTRIGDVFDSVCTGAAEKGTWVRIFHPPVEGRLTEGYQGVDVGDRLKVRLVKTDVNKGYIDFVRPGPGRQIETSPRVPADFAGPPGSAR